MVKKVFKKIWKFIWKDDSVLSWIVSFILAFLLVKFLIYPGIGLIMGTSYPIVAVVSDSMEHRGLELDEWWELQGDWYDSKGIDKEMFRDYIFLNGFNKGDIIILRGSETKDIKIGDVIVFHSTSNYPVIHRVVDKWEDDKIYHFQTKGDNNPDSHIGLNEDDIGEGRIVGRAVFKVPWLGWIKIWFSELVGIK